VVRGAEDGQLAAAVEVDERADVQDLLGPEDVRVDAERAVQRDLLPFHLERVLGVAEVQLTLVREQDVEVQLPREIPVAAEALAVEGHGLGGVVVGSEHLRVAAARAAAEVRALEHRDLPDPVPRGEVVRERQTVHAAAHDHDVVPPRERPLAEEPTTPEQARHRASSAIRRRR
jgi:hypothetical protein